MKTLVKNGTIVTAEGSFKGDLLMEGEIITEIGESVFLDSGWVFDAEGMFVLPGGVDPHVHLHLPMAGTVSSDDYYTGGKAAAFGGTTTVIDFVSQGPGTLADSVKAHRELADATASVDYASHMNITHFNDQIGEQNAGIINCL